MRVLVTIITFLILGGSPVFGQTTASRSMSRSRTASRRPSRSRSASRTPSISRTASITPSISITDLSHDSESSDFSSEEDSSSSSSSFELASSIPSTSRSASDLSRDSESSDFSSEEDSSSSSSSFELASSTPSTSRSASASSTRSASLSLSASSTPSTSRSASASITPSISITASSTSSASLSLSDDGSGSDDDGGAEKQDDGSGSDDEGGAEKKASSTPSTSSSASASITPSMSIIKASVTPSPSMSISGYILKTLSTECSTGGCGHCEGACTSNVQCAAGLVCFTRSGLEAVPFCAGEGQSGVGYCVPADTSDPAIFYDAARENCPNCNFGLCVGDCDEDSDCAPGLSCFQRDAGMPVPGCSGTAVDAKDYCYFKELKVTNDNCGAACNFKACQGDCDTDAECGWPASGLKCFQRNWVESVPGCYGTGVRARDYCYNPYLQTTTPTAPPPPPPRAFRFGVAGDFGLSPRFYSMVDLVAISALDFFVATGDLSYTPGGEATWCSYWQQMGIYNLLLLAGNHETGEDYGGDIDQYIKNCRNDLSSAVSDLSLYGKRYYVDFPVAAPMVRIIFVTPGVTGSLEWLNTFEINGQGFNYTRDAVLAAKAQGIKWIIVAMHKNFISVLTKSNELGSDFIPMLFQNGVDLILQGHEHGYERTKQITCAVVDSYDVNCVVDADNVMVKGSGTVIAVVGTGGVDLRTMDPADAEWGYFASVDISTYGFGMVTVTQSQLEFQFIRSSYEGSLNDTFVIQDPVVRRRAASLGMQDQNTGDGYTHKVSATTTKRRASAAVSGRLSRAGLRPSV
eukprot:g25698.t1